MFYNMDQETEKIELIDLVSDIWKKKKNLFHDKT